MTTVVSVEVSFECPETKQKVVVSGNQINVVGHCANDEYSMEHDIEFHCPSCGHFHTVG
jgi:hypothetical protein